MDPYEVLGISPHCTNEELKNTFRKLMLQYHPDKAGPDAKAKCQQIIAAYHFILEDEYRYDAKMQKRAYSGRFDAVLEYWYYLNELEQGKLNFRSRLAALEKHFGADINALEELADAFNAAFPSLDDQLRTPSASRNTNPSTETDEDKAEDEESSNEDEANFSFRSRTGKSHRKELIQSKLELLVDFEADLSYLEKQLLRRYRVQCAVWK